MSDDVTPQRPEDVHSVIPVARTASACAGAAAGFLVRRIAYRAGAYAPGIQEQMFHELTTAQDGATLDRVQQWFAARNGTLQQLGYRLQVRRVAQETASLVEWVREGGGHRGVLLATNSAKLHPTAIASSTGAHAVAVAFDRLTPEREAAIVVVDPWPNATERTEYSPAVFAAHRDRGHQALVVFWSGWS